MPRNVPHRQRRVPPLRGLTGAVLVVVVVSVAGFIVATQAVESERRAATLSQARAYSAQAAILLQRAESATVSSASELSQQPVAGSRNFATIVGASAATLGLSDAMWVQQVAGHERRAYERETGLRIVPPQASGRRPSAAPSYLVARDVSGLGLRPGTDVSGLPALARALSRPEAILTGTATGQVTVAGQRGFFLVQRGQFGSGPRRQGFLVVFVPAGWLVLSLSQNADRAAIFLDGEHLGGTSGQTPHVSQSFPALTRDWRIELAQRPETALQALLPKLALAWAPAIALVVYLTGRGITRRRRAEHEVDDIFDLSLDLLCILGVDGHLKRLNPAFGQTLGYGPTELLARPLAEFVHPDDRDETTRAIDRVWSGEQAAPFSARFLRSDGVISWLTWNMRAVVEQGLIYGTAHDDTAIRTLLAEQGALQRVATLVARGAPADEVFEAVASETRAVLEIERLDLLRLEPDGATRVVALAGAVGERGPTYKVGDRWTPLAGGPVDLALGTARPARVDGSDGESDSRVDEIARLGSGGAVAVPIVIEGSLWGVIAAGWGADRSAPSAIEDRLMQFAGLVATAIGNADARENLRQIAAEQAALRRVATLVARAEAPEVVFARVAEEIANLVPTANVACVGRYRDDDAIEWVGAWSRDGSASLLGDRVALGGADCVTLVHKTKRPARATYTGDDASTPSASARRSFRASAGAPINIEGRLWGAMIVGGPEPDALPAGTEERLEQFTELVATAVANADGRAALADSRRRVVVTADETRRRIERDLHDGAQQRLVHTIIALQLAQGRLGQDGASDDARDLIAQALTTAQAANDELRELARGIHPGVLTKGGLPLALATIAKRSPIPVQLELHTHSRFDERVELTAYFVTSEALVNAAKHSNASSIRLALKADDGNLSLSISDDGIGGADAAGGSGLLGLRDRVEAAGGKLTVGSPPGGGTHLEVLLPLDSP